MFTRKIIYLVLISSLTMNQFAAVETSKQKSPVLSRKDKIAKSAGIAVTLIGAYFSGRAFYSLCRVNQGLKEHKAMELRSEYDHRPRKGVYAWFDGPSPKLSLNRNKQQINDRLWKAIPATLVGVAFFYWGHKQGAK